MSDNAVPDAAQPADLVAPGYPPLPAVRPVRARRIPWTLALPAALLALLLPRRLGPHLAASSWLAAYVVHLLSIILFWGSLWAFIREENALPGTSTQSITASLSWSEHLRRPLAACVLFAYVVAFASWPAIVGGVLTALLGHTGVWAAATLLIPMYAAGERRRALYLRCVKLLLWSTACLIPLGYVIPVLIRVLELADWMFPEVLLGLTAAGLLWYATVLLRLGSRYGGPAEGPGWQARELRCEGCGYVLTLSPISGRCPECGRPVAESLPDRRRLPPFARARGLTGRIRGYAQTLWQSLATRRFARTTCVRQGHEAARRFTWVTCALIGLLVGLASFPSVLVGRAYLAGVAGGLPLWLDHWAGLTRAALRMSVIGVATGLGVLAGILLVGGFVTLFGFRDATRRSIVLCYASGWLLIPTVLGIAGVYATAAAYELLPLSGTVVLPLCGWPVEIGLLVGTGLMLPAIATFLLWFLHLRWQLRETRFANA